jgi:hypothetical protein
LTGNNALYGGGDNNSLLYNCILSGNFAYIFGGGACSNTLRNCALFGNSTIGNGGGAFGCSLNSCTLANNSAASGGGVDLSQSTNCIVYYNIAATGSNYTATNSLSYCCTTPLPGSGAGNFSADPQLADGIHLSAGSPCRGAGNSLFTTGLDIDGEAWANPPSIGCDEYYAGAITGSITVSVQGYTNLATGFTNAFFAQINGRATSNYWAFGDGSTATNLPYLSHGWSAAGNYTITLWVFNESNPGGTSASLIVHVVDNPVQYVALDSINPTVPYLSWSSAATNIQNAMDAAYLGGSILVSNGIYNTGGRPVYGLLTNRVAVTRPVTVQSINGPAVTIIQGYQLPGHAFGDGAIRCVYLTNGASVIGFTLTNGATRESGEFNTQATAGGAWCESTNALLSNCIIISNSAVAVAGGVYAGTLDSCVISNNFTSDTGGAASSVLRNCTLGGNKGNWGGASSCSLSNCVLISNLGFTIGGANNCILSGCQVIGNSSPNTPGGAGGLSGGTAIDCTISNNTSVYGAGGAALCVLSNCVIASNRATNNGGGTLGCTLINCVISNNWAGQAGGAAYSAFSSPSTLTGCIVVGNSSALGGATVSCTLSNCTVASNVGTDLNGSAIYGGAAYSCTISNNSCRGYGGGAQSATLVNCILCGNRATNSGGGAYMCPLTGCTLSNNWAKTSGGGAAGSPNSTVIDCLFSGNSTAGNGGGIDHCTSSNCTLIANSASMSGGAASSSTLINSIIVSNQANAIVVNQGYGGGAVSCTLKNCLVAGNQAIGIGGVSSSRGGGAYQSTLVDCTVTANTANSAGGGTYSSGLNNCIVYYNTAPTGSNYSSAPSLSYCCTQPFAAGTGNLTNAPLFVNLAVGDYHLQSNSPCINSGNNTFAATTSDLDGNPRISGGTVDIGAYEFQNPASVISYAWLQQYGLPTDGSADYADSDGDRANNWQEWKSGTSPIDPASVLKLLSVVATNNPPGRVVTWQSVNTETYYLQSSTNSGPASFSVIQSNIVGQAGTTSFTDTNTVGSGPVLYRVGVQ